MTGVIDVAFGRSIHEFSDCVLILHKKTDSDNNYEYNGTVVYDKVGYTTFKKTIFGLSFGMINDSTIPQELLDFIYKLQK